jgi:hypothetical protein
VRRKGFTPQRKLRTKKKEKRAMKKLLAIVPILLLAASVSHAQSNTGTSTLSVTVGAEAAIVVNTTPAFGSTGIFGAYTATTGFTYFIRTISGGNITVSATADFSTGGPNGGPSIVVPPTAGDTLTYTCAAASVSTGSANACSSAQTVSALNAGQNVVTFGATTQSAKLGNSSSTSWTLTNDPSYKAGSYSATVLYTISAS